jgi:hypothetical protein
MGFGEKIKQYLEDSMLPSVPKPGRPTRAQQEEARKYQEEREKRENGQQVEAADEVDARIRRQSIAESGRLAIFGVRESVRAWANTPYRTTSGVLTKVLLTEAAHDTQPSDKQ